MKTAWVSVLVFVAACGGKSAAPMDNAGGAGAAGAEPGSGTRLVPWQLEAPGTRPVQVGILDTEQHVACQFVPDETGTLRCFPAGSPLVASGAFTDSSCREPVYESNGLQLTDEASAPVTLAESTSSGCGYGFRVVRVRRAESAGARFYLDPQSGECVEGGRGAPPEPDAVVVQQVPSASYVAGVEVDGPLWSERVRLQKIQAEDGSLFDSRLVDLRWEASCTVTPDELGLSCRTEVARTDENYTSDTCEGETVAESFCDGAPYALTRDGAFALGEAWTGPVFHGPKGCYEDSPAVAARSRYYELGAPLDGEIVPYVKAGFSGSQRLRAHGAETDSGEPLVVSSWLLLSAGWFDTESDTTCRPVRAPDGKVRCVPTTLSGRRDLGAFADAECTIPLHECYTAGCNEPILVDAGTDSAAHFVESAREVRASAPFDGPSYYPGINGVCTKNESEARPFGILGELLSWDDYPVLAERNAPSATP